MPLTAPKLNLKVISYPNSYEPSEKTAAQELSKITGASLSVGNSGLYVSLATS